MKKKILGIFVCTLMIATVFAVVVTTNVSATDSRFAGGSGTVGDPYQISNVYELQNMSKNLTEHFALINNIDASVTSTWNNGGGFDPIGSDYNNRFFGSFDGQNYTISNLFINRSSEDCIGLFGWAHFAPFENVRLENVNIIGRGHVAGLVGFLWGWNIYITNCHVTGNVEGRHRVGGLVGSSYKCALDSCSSTANVYVGTWGGGLIGFNPRSVSNCYATGNVYGNSGAGGLIGYTGGYTNNCYATGSVSGSREVGGLIGHNEGPVDKCYSIGEITGGSFLVGGLIGCTYQTTITNSFWDNQTSGMTTSAGGAGKTTAEMKDVATYTDTDTVGLDNPWDFVGNPYDDTGNEDIWNISSTINNEYPHLTCFIINNLPLADAGGPYEADEGSEITFNASGSTDPDGDILLYRWDFDNDGTWDTDYSANPTSTHKWYDDYNGTVKVEVYDGLDTDTDTALVIVNNVAPTITSLNPTVDPVPINTTVNLTATFTDPGWLDTHTVTIDWDDGNTSAGDLTGSNGSYTVADSWAYAQAGVYTITLTIEDDDGGSDTEIFQYVVAYNSDDGFVTGGGWIDSPEGAYTPNPDLTGKANFGFVSKYKKGQQTPTGNTEFNFKLADMNFHSSSYDWLVIAGKKAMYKGTGTINNEGNYGFLLSAIDEELTPSTDVDLFRIKIWDKDNNDEVIYDNMLGEEEDTDPTTEIGGGNIKIHTG